MAFDPREPYDDLPALPPAVDIETKAILRRAVSASRALAELKGMGGIVPAQAHQLISVPKARMCASEIRQQAGCVGILAGEKAGREQVYRNKALYGPWLSDVSNYSR
ncbi:MAG: hypothetical protein WCQ50_12055 [Spirochaetota bacterium]